ncbi:MAG: hypothetical protein VYD52_00290 [Pseudomonadota bacterium]|nr:hypothetical protein [Pseudomonadota bacterium]MED5441356.1 hypothetical protein [Pseudomonadota bacterium]MEE3190943.1 hypothetical protein [Pseudomonadota bacterium]
MHANRAEWIIRPSGLQQRVEVLTWLSATLLLVFALLGTAFWGSTIYTLGLLAVVPLALAVRALLAKREPVLIGKNTDGWWLLRDNTKVPVSFHSGSIRRRKLIVLVWGFWPWQALIIRPDCFLSREPFNHLKYELYGSI